MKRFIILTAFVFVGLISQAQEIVSFTENFTWLDFKSSQESEWITGRNIDIDIIFNKDGIEGKILIRSKKPLIITPVNKIETLNDEEGEYQFFNGIDQNGVNCNVIWRAEKGILVLDNPEKDWLTRFVKKEKIDNSKLEASNN